jgi:outer membrane receptor for ferrienterochelin and colicins
MPSGVFELILISFRKKSINTTRLYIPIRKRPTMKCYIILFVSVLFAATAEAQRRVHIQDAETGMPIPAVMIRTDSAMLANTDSLGNALIPAAREGQQITFSRFDYQEIKQHFSNSDTGVWLIKMATDKTELEDVVVVASTRNDENIENSPLKVEVLGKAEMSEEAGLKPGNIASILSDVSGVQVQQSSATSGNSNVRIQGLDGRYTQILRDGMPMYDGFSGGLGIMTIPPLDLQQVELIKGSASTLYGGGAIGGLVNLISKRPTLKQEADVLLNYTSLKELNANAYLAKRNKKFGYTFFTGYSNQQAVDVNDDGFSDAPDLSSVLLHPKFFFYPTEKTTISVGYSGTFDKRKGGDMQLLDGGPTPVHRYFEDNESQRNTAEYAIEHYYSGRAKLVFKGNYSNFYKQTSTDEYLVKGNQASYYDEVSLLQPFGKSNLVAGINITGDEYKTRSPDTMSLQSARNFTAGVFAQFNWHIKDNTILETGLRADHHDVYGFFVLPRIAVFHRFTDQWAARAGFGMGYKTPNPLVPQNIEYDLPQLLPVPNGLSAEISYGYNAEVNYKKEWDKEHTLFINQAFFLTQVYNPILFELNHDNKVAMSNAAKPLLSMGSDTYVKLQLKTWELYLGYTYTDARRQYLSSNSFVPLTPRNRMAFVVVKEMDKWRFGLEGSYMGSQYRYDATKTPAYMFLAAMVQRNLDKHIILVLNAENLLDYRMSREESLYTGSISQPVFKPLWAPIDGRVVNFSIRWKL